MGMEPRGDHLQEQISRFLHPIVAACHAAVLRDRGPAGFVGRIGLAVDHGAAVDWWTCSFSGQAQPEFTTSWPEAMNFFLVLTSPGRDISFPSTDCQYWEGDRSLWQRFCRRYGRRSNAVSIRLTGHPKELLR